jgi:ribulose 1,5-bisphosphate synthetase/thiazole synthase
VWLFYFASTCILYQYENEVEYLIYDVAVIGAGVVGALTARELSKYKPEYAYWKRATMWRREAARPTAR